MARSVDTEPGHFVLRMMEATTGIEPVYAVLQIDRSVLSIPHLSTNPSANVPRCPPIFAV